MDVDPTASTDSLGPWLVTASLRHSVSFQSPPQKPHMALYERRAMLQTWAPQRKILRLGLVPGHSFVRLGTMLLLGIIFLPSIHCDTESVSYSSREIVIPKRLTVKGRDNLVEKASYVLFMQGQKQLVHLKVKRDYFVNNFPVYSYHNGILGQEMPFTSHDCHYEGYIEGVPASFVSVNICSGLRGVLIKEETSYGIEPVPSSKRFEHVLYTTAHQARISCGVTAKDSQVVSASQQEGSRRPPNLQAPSYLWSHTKYVEMFVVVNNQRFQMWGSNVSETVRGVVDIIALANSFTRGINTEVVLAGMEIWTEGDLIEVPVDLRVTLRNFNSWRRETLFRRGRHDVAHMIVGHHPGENTGQAFLDGACSSGFAAAVESFHHEDVLLFAALMAHELGHNLGIRHDHSACMCEDKRLCLMCENITKESGFSNCSSDYFYHFLRERRGACLFNNPWHRSRKRRVSSCGNGVVEDSEQCDCGDACENNQCCDQNCKLKGQAQCSNEPCCSRCKFRHQGYVCRHSLRTCDLPEYCNGTSAECPEDRYMQDGSECHKTYSCLQAKCMDPSEQCANIFGFGSTSAPEACYTSINSKGNRFGNCGHPSGKKGRYVQCSDENKLCGKLICTGVPSLPPIKLHHTLIQVPSGDDWCWSMDHFENEDISDVGEVENGTVCAPQKACMNFHCADTTVDKLVCNPDEMCNGNGVCNDLGHCHCGDGFAPPDCKNKGHGGSIDSGPPKKSDDEPSDIEVSQNTTSQQKEDMAVKLRLLFLAILFGLLVLAVIICFMCLFKSPESPAAEIPPPAPTEKVPEQAPAEEAPSEEAPSEEASEEASEEEQEAEEESESES